jgi:hypothetical protein
LRSAAWRIVSGSGVVDAKRGLLVVADVGMHPGDVEVGVAIHDLAERGRADGVARNVRSTMWRGI